MAVKLELSFGDFFDRLTILEIKRDRVADAAKRTVIESELARFEAARNSIRIDQSPAAAMIRKLRSINEELWDIEDRIRAFEKARDFGEGFIACARSVYLTNDQRAEIKRNIDTALGSDVYDVKFYSAD